MAKKKALLTGKVNRVCYIDAALDARMKKASEVNWSAVASAAFERELRMVEGRAMLKTTVERMRLEEEEDRSEAFREGREAGRKWATEKARLKELRRLDSWVASHGNSYDAIELSAGDVVDAIEGDEKTRWDDAVEWFDPEGCSESDISDESLLRGFVDGALDVWSEVEPQL